MIITPPPITKINRTGMAAINNAKYPFSKLSCFESFVRGPVVGKIDK